MRNALIAAFVLIGLGTGVAAFQFARSPSRPVAAPVHPVWSEVKWPFPMDQWGTGQGFRCKANDCGREVDVYLRPKIGFCNCTTGVADDEELERLADFDLFRERQTAVSPGRPIDVRWMKGRARAYLFAGSFVRPKSTLTVAFNDRCDAIVATAVVDEDHRAESESLVLDFLRGDVVIHWTEAMLGL
jgi:hypothetical protein